jgi:lysophospholipase L1-like esterase
LDESPATTSTPASAQRRRSYRRELLLALGAVVLPLLVLELLARLLFAPPPPNAFPGLTPSSMADPELLWRNRPGYAPEDEHGPINSLGFRGAEPAARRAAIRILSLGESTTFGDGVPWRETYSHHLEELLQERGHDVEILNGGQRAWTIVQTLRFLELELAEIAPDIVLVYHEWNDFLPTTWRSTRLRGAGLTDRQILSLSWFLRLAESSRLVTTLRLAWARARAEGTVRALGERLGVDPLQVTNFPWRRLPSHAPRGEKPWMDNPRPYVRVPDADREASLERLVALTRSQDVTLVLLHPAYRISRPHRCVLTRVAEEQGVTWFEVEDVLGGSGRRAELRKASLYLDNVHPNAQGHAALAAALAQFLEERVLGGRGEGPG